MTEIKRPQNLEELCDYIAKYSKCIYIRIKFEGEWQPKCLAELPGDIAIREALKFIREGRVPHRLVEPIEVVKND